MRTPDGLETLGARTSAAVVLTHWGRVTHICVSKLTIIDSDNGLLPRRHQAIIWTNAGILLIEPLGTIFSQILVETHTFSFKKMHLKMSSGKCQPFCLGLIVSCLFAVNIPLSMWQRQNLVVMAYLTSYIHQGISLRMRPANEKCRYNVTTSLIGWAQT